MKRTMFSLSVLVILFVALFFLTKIWEKKSPVQSVPSTMPTDITESPIVPITTEEQYLKPTILLVTSPAITFIPTPSLTETVLTTIKPTKIVTPQTAKPTTRATEIKTLLTPKPTVEPTSMPTAEGVTPMSSSYKNAVLSGVNYVRIHNGDYKADPIDQLDDVLCAMAQAHAEAMAIRGVIYHDCPGPESVACGSSGMANGENAGVQSAVHAAGLLNPEVTRIGVGAAKSNDGIIYLCVVGE